jgi:hypothetical protein
VEVAEMFPDSDDPFLQFGIQLYRVYVNDFSHYAITAKKSRTSLASLNLEITGLNLCPNGSRGPRAYIGLILALIYRVCGSPIKVMFFLKMRPEIILSYLPIRTHWHWTCPPYILTKLPRWIHS